MSRLDAVAVRKYQDRDGNEKTAYTTVGVAWPFKDKEGFTLRLNAIPAPTDGEYVILLMPPNQKDKKPQTTHQNERQAKTFHTDLDDDLPF